MVETPVTEQVLLESSIAMTSQAKVVRVIWAAFLLTFAWGGWLYRSLFGTVWGCFVLTVLLYSYSLKWFGVSPLKVPGGLIDWFDSLPTEAKSAIGSGLLTLVGFLAAFWSAYAVWRRQTAVTIKMDAVNDMTERLQQAFHQILELDGYLYMLQNAVTSARNCDPAAPGMLVFVNGKAQAFIATRARLHECRMGLLAAKGRHTNALANNPAASDRIEWAIQTVIDAWDACQFEPPCSDPNNDAFVLRFLGQVNDQTIAEARRLLQLANSRGNALMGFARGQLLGAVLAPNFAATLHLTRQVWNPATSEHMSAIFPGRRRK